MTKSSFTLKNIERRELERGQIYSGGSKWSFSTEPNPINFWVISEFGCPSNGVAKYYSQDQAQRKGNADSHGVCSHSQFLHFAILLIQRLILFYISCFVTNRGLDNSGKTTIVLKINGEDTSVISPTLGFNIKTISYDRWSFFSSLSFHLMFMLFQLSNWGSCPQWASTGIFFAIRLRPHLGCS